MEYPLHMTRTEALTRRADKLSDWIKAEEYSVYIDCISTENLVRLIDLMIYAFEMSLPKDQWLPFLRRFRNARTQALAIFDTEEEFSDNHTKVITTLLSVLDKYKLHVRLSEELADTDK